ncbi:hypothetical protein [Actinomyces sp. MRS3W]|uniref:hypothetical protein n=1 Tax=Actinomyces sp. MRS3W TaxID=2800796 RepID=UPI0028FDAD84|nr:hypothetical protein [Actinomyces sp. MRS3W]MDU0347847.1 hypothetical protein [Actinomyces sp. MRS3W]
MTRAPRIALVCATAAAVAPARAAILDQAPTADVWTLLDDRLFTDARDAHSTSGPYEERFLALLTNARLGGADGVLVTCSLFGATALRATSGWEIPVGTSDGAVFAQVAAAGLPDITVVGSAEAPTTDAVNRLRAHLADAGSSTRVDGRAVDAALSFASAGDEEGLLHALEEGTAHVAGPILLAQYSLGPVAERLSRARGETVLAGPTAAARSLLAAVHRSGRTND